MDKINLSNVLKVMQTLPEEMILMEDYDVVILPQPKFATKEAILDDEGIRLCLDIIRDENSKKALYFNKKKGLDKQDAEWHLVQIQSLLQINDIIFVEDIQRNLEQKKIYHDAKRFRRLYKNYI